jgi:hypothetical protein
MFSLQQNLRRGRECGAGWKEMAQTMYTLVSKCKNKEKEEKLLHTYRKNMFSYKS